MLAAAAAELNSLFVEPSERWKIRIEANMNQKFR